MADTPNLLLTFHEIRNSVCELFRRHPELFCELQGVDEHLHSRFSQRGAVHPAAMIVGFALGRDSTKRLHHVMCTVTHRKRLLLFLGHPFHLRIVFWSELVTSTNKLHQSPEAVHLSQLRHSSNPPYEKLYQLHGKSISSH